MEIPTNPLMALLLAFWTLVAVLSLAYWLEALFASGSTEEERHCILLQTEEGMPFWFRCKLAVSMLLTPFTLLLIGRSIRVSGRPRKR